MYLRESRIRELEIEMKLHPDTVIATIATIEEDGRSFTNMFIAPNEQALIDVIKNRPILEDGRGEMLRKINIAGKIEIDCVTGNVTLTDCTLLEAGALFWQTVECMFPYRIRN